MPSLFKLNNFGVRKLPLTCYDQGPHFLNLRQINAQKAHIALLKSLKTPRFDLNPPLFRMTTMENKIGLKKGKGSASAHQIGWIFFTSFQTGVDLPPSFGNYLPFFPKNTLRNTLRINFWIDPPPHGKK